MIDITLEVEKAPSPWKSGSIRLWRARSGDTISPFSIPTSISVILQDGLQKKSIGHWMELK
jgi:hypothetical protein